ncbi:SPP1 phage holin family protein [Metallumcola ferriviriculae]|uniref:SPP1 phage holin family protein n=1 Tax=Metallumcola ferriviriculae TaxID=3039180 RepID=A0AAU0UP58_9FIRM|nr:SPP1 phage holin family protein [Desulfitibacteraceae bacterium MK1]
MNPISEILLWVVGTLAFIFLGGLYFWAKNPKATKPNMFDARDETEAEILTEVSNSSEREKERRAKENEPYCKVHEKD